MSSGGWRLTPQLAKQITHYAKFPATGVSLRQMVQFGSNPGEGTLFRASQFIVEELPIRLAHRVKDLEALPLGLSEMPSIKRVKDWYAQSFEELTTIPSPMLDKDVKSLLYKPSKERAIYLGQRDIAIKPEQGSNVLHPTMADWQAEGFSQDQYLTNSSASHHHANPYTSARKYFADVEPGVHWPQPVKQYNREVTDRLTKIKKRHDGTVSAVAQGVLEWKETRPDLKVDYSIQSFLDRFYMSRIGIRMLIGQHIALNKDRGLRHDYVGIICTKTNIHEIAQSAIDNARFICEDWYGLYEAPQVEIICNPDINFMYVPGHLSHMIFETIKNSLRAVVETHGVDADYFPPVRVIVAEGKEDITIKISDEGGGIPRSAVPHVWTYMYTTATNTPPLDLDTSSSDFKAPLAGFGYGLPISRLYARYFGGDLKLISLEGYGTDVYLHLNRLSSSSEPLPP